MCLSLCVLELPGQKTKKKTFPSLFTLLQYWSSKKNQGKERERERERERKSRSEWDKPNQIQWLIDAIVPLQDTIITLSQTQWTFLKRARNKGRRKVWEKQKKTVMKSKGKEKERNNKRKRKWMSEREREKRKGKILHRANHLEGEESALVSEEQMHLQAKSLRQLH